MSFDLMSFVIAIRRICNMYLIIITDNLLVSNPFGVPFVRWCGSPQFSPVPVKYITCLVENLCRLHSTGCYVQQIFIDYVIHMSIAIWSGYAIFVWRKFE